MFVISNPAIAGEKSHQLIYGYRNEISRETLEMTHTFSMISEKSLSRLAHKILHVQKVQNATLDIFLLPHDEMAEIKWRLMKKKSEPNVLSFPELYPFPHPEKKKKKFLGEVLLNKDILKRSPERTIPLLVHGIVHLLGYDHEKKDDNGTMTRTEEKIIASLGKVKF